MDAPGRDDGDGWINGPVKSSCGGLEQEHFTPMKQKKRFTGACGLKMD